mmetsp:Transcript_32/g.89  ORF Transcript_32/g.89 Transcript_32/m.89 type:complete len:84 (-) Transcript_32:850-1101(-)
MVFEGLWIPQGGWRPVQPALQQPAPAMNMMNAYNQVPTQPYAQLPQAGVKRGPPAASLSVVGNESTEKAIARQTAFQLGAIMA